MRLDTHSLENAVCQLECSLSYLCSELAQNDDGLRDQFRAAIILPFEYPFGLATEMIRRQLAQIVVAPSELGKMAFMDLIRTAAEAGWVQNVPSIKASREMRNITSHTYNAEVADKVLFIVDDFVGDVLFLLTALKQRNGLVNH